MHVNVAIVGLDRLGVSLGLALKRYQSQPRAEHSFTIIGSDPKGEAMKTAEKLGAVDNFHRTLSKATDNADLLIVNVPYGSTEDLYARLGPDLKRGAVVLDLSPLKQPVIGWANEYFPKNEKGQLLAYVVGLTPVINVSGLYSGDLGAEGARPDLFDKADILVAPDAKAPSEAIALAEDVIRLIGGQPRFIDPLEHDGLIAATEGLPSLVGAALFYTIQQSEGWMELRRMVNPALALATQNLRRQTPRDLFAQFTQNRENLARHLESLIGVLDQLHDALTGEDLEFGELEAFLNVVHNEWEKWDIKRHSGKWEETTTPEVLPGPFGSVAGFLTLTRRKKDDDEE
jgi:prephenate dehydrogenase